MTMTSTKVLSLCLLGGVALAGGILAAHGDAPSPKPVAMASVTATTVTAVDPEVLEPIADPDPGAPDPARVREAVTRGLDYLRRTQDPSTGGWVQDVGYKVNSSYTITRNKVPHVGVSALALMAFLSGGHLPGRGEHSEVVERGIDFILNCVDPESGYITAEGSRMYSHAFAALLLAEVYGMTHREDVKEKLQLAIDLTRKAQNIHGSWRYNPHSPESDMSITVCQIMALRAARNIGIKVPKETIDRAYQYVVDSAYTGRNSRFYGGFRYQLKDQARTSYPLTAAGVATLNHSGIYDHDLIRAGIEYLQEEQPRMSRRYLNHFFYWYGNYYAAQVFFLAGDKDNGLWEWYWNRIANELLNSQQPDGSWPNPVGPGTNFSTAVATIILQIPNQYLPIFHR